MNKTFIKPQCFLSAYYVLVSVLVTRDIKMKKRSHSLFIWRSNGIWRSNDNITNNY